MIVFKKSSISLAIGIKSYWILPYTIEAYQLASETFPYPLHIGVTEAGTKLGGTIKSSLGIGTILYQGIGNTIRVSLSDNPIEEIKVGKILLKELELIDNVPTLVSCPTCGRIQYDLIPYLSFHLYNYKVLRCNDYLLKHIDYFE